MTGIVKKFFEKAGYGFIQPLIGKPDTTPEVFFHVSSVRGRIAPPIGAEVRFKLVRGEHGPQAANVELLELNAASLNREAARS
jgi:cold shock CspA family protein